MDHRLRGKALSEYELCFIMTGIAHGLATLHKAGVIRRELSPQSVLLRKASDRPILTDMELAKVASPGPTVSPDEWPDDPYRALEVAGDAPPDVRADVYSWGRIFAHAATGALSERGEESLPRDDIPEAVRDLVRQSVEVLPSKRPKDMKPILKALKVWQ
jgi:serine/threonine protein kinase